MKIIIGLGNPGKEFDTTRHNAGFLCVDFLQKEWSFENFRRDAKMSAEISAGMVGKEKYLLIKPTTFMNDSGIATQALIRFYKLTVSDIIVIHDDLDIDLGIYKKTLSSRSAGHNGVADIIEKIGTQDFFRIRLGIGRPKGTDGACISTHDYVLERFSPSELDLLETTFPRVQTVLQETSIPSLPK